jgi:hypothetical protein
MPPPTGKIFEIKFPESLEMHSILITFQENRHDEKKRSIIGAILFYFFFT